MQWARDNACIIFTHDLDFTTLLAVTDATGPSVIQVRTQNALPEAVGETLFKAIRQFEHELKSGALLSIDSHRSKARMLPLKAKPKTQNWPT